MNLLMKNKIYLRTGLNRNSSCYIENYQGIHLKRFDNSWLRTGFSNIKHLKSTCNYYKETLKELFEWRE